VKQSHSVSPSEANSCIAGDKAWLFTRTDSWPHTWFFAAFLLLEFFPAQMWESVSSQLLSPSFERYVKR